VAANDTHTHMNSRLTVPMYNVIFEPNVNIAAT